MFPNGTVLIKQFRRDGRLLETRFYVRHDDGGWSGYTYRWNDTQTDAVLLHDADTVTTDERTWTIPSRAQCDQCHTEAAGRSLGLEVGQLNHEWTYPNGQTANQLESLIAAGLVNVDTSRTFTEHFPGLAEANATTEERVRSYLNSNCAHCHRPGGPGRGNLDLRVATSLTDSALCQETTLGAAGTLIVEAGNPTASEILTRMRSTDGSRMPPVGTSLIDVTATTEMDNWIAQLTSCP